MLLINVFKITVLFGVVFDVFVISVKNEKIKIEEDYSSSAINASIPNDAHSGHTQSSGMSAGVAPAGMLYAGSPFSVSNLYSQCKQTYIVILLSPYFFYQHCQYNFNCIDTYI